MLEKLECQTNTNIRREVPAKSRVDPIDVALADVLCIFAARGRAIREERAKREAARVLPGSAPDTSEKHERELNDPKDRLMSESVRG